MGDSDAIRMGSGVEYQYDGEGGVVVGKTTGGGEGVRLDADNIDTLLDLSKNEGVYFTDGSISAVRRGIGNIRLFKNTTHAVTVTDTGLEQMKETIDKDAERPFDGWLTDEIFTMGTYSINLRNDELAAVSEFSGGGGFIVTSDMKRLERSEEARGLGEYTQRLGDGEVLYIVDER